MADSKFITAPLKTDKMPPGIPFIIATEAAERFSYYGMSSILAVFMTKYLRDSSGALAVMTENEANQRFHDFSFLGYFLPFMGAFLADAFLGKFRTILYVSLVYCGGHLALAIDDTRTGLGIGMVLIAIGMGGIKPCVSAIVGDQFGATNQHLLSKAFGWFYFAINSGSLVAFWLIPLLLDKLGPRWAFGVPGIFMAVAALIFWFGRYKFVHIPAPGWDSFRRNFDAEGLAAIGRIAVLYLFVAVFWSLWSQSQSEWVLQAEKMDRHLSLFGWNFEMLSSQMQLLNGGFILLMIVVCNYVLYPLISRFWPLNELRKIGLGLAVTCGSFLIIAWIETRIGAGLRPSIAWQVPAFLLLSTGEVMVSVTSLEFAYTQAPKRLKAMIMILYLWAIAFGNLLVARIHSFISNADGSSKLPGASFYLFFVALCAVTTVVYAFVSRSYTTKTHLQDEAPAA
ncbi:MAG TPA: MFS transporter [Lacunisphaera sp.]|nr:MFS transporter [Lacunisphaera sp.]